MIFTCGFLVWLVAFAILARTAWVVIQDARRPLPGDDDPRYDDPDYPTDRT